MFYRHKNGIGFRKLEESDLEQLKSLKDDSWSSTVNTTCVNMADQKNWFNAVNSDKTCLYFIIYDGLPGKPIGLYGITEINVFNRSCSFTHSLFVEARGQGLGNKSLQAATDMIFEVFNMRRIETWILETNLTEIKVAKNTDFILEGFKREAIYKCGKYINCGLYGLLRKEWENSERVQAFNGGCNKSSL